MTPELQTLIEAIKDYGAAMLGTVSVGAIGAVAGIIIKVKQGIDKTKEQMSSLLAKKDNETQAINNQYLAVISKMEQQNKKIEKLTEEISRIEINE